MKRVEIAAYGIPEEVARCAESPDVGAPGTGEAVIEVLASPINPADVLLCHGTYAVRPPLPNTPGAECVGRVAAIGAGVTGLAPGDLVINVQRENWAQKRRVAAVDLIKLPAGIDIRQAAMLKVNPATARLMLDDFVKLERGDWIAQNVANSAVGRMVIAISKERGLRTVNLVRRPELIQELRALGADLCLVDGPELPAQVRAAGANVRFAMDAVGGEGTARLAAIVADGGTLCHYGSMTRENPLVTNGDLIFRTLTFRGFMLGNALARRSRQQVCELYAELAAGVVAGRLFAPVERVYPIEEIGPALAHAQGTRPGGKILLAPNGMV